MKSNKFKAWSERKKCWFEPKVQFIAGLSGEIEMIVPATIEFGKADIVWFTGLLDKNGKEIYEGDIVKCMEVDGDLYPPKGTPYKFREEHHLVEWIQKEGRYEAGHSNFTSIGYEVIGNVMENPELLKS